MVDVIANDLAAIFTMSVSPMWLVAVTVLMVSAPAKSVYAFLVGWFLGVALMVGGAAVLGTSPAGEVADDSGFNYLALVAGALFLYLGIRSFRNRPVPGEPVEEPGWMSTMATMPLWKLTGLAIALLIATAKNIPLYLLVGADIANSGMPFAEGILTVAVVGLIATSTPFAIAMVPAIVGERADSSLAALRDWLVNHNAVITGMVFTLLGLSELGKALGSA